MSHIPQDKSDKTRESPTYWGLKELPIWPRLSPTYPGVGGGGGAVSGSTLTGAL